MRQRTKIFISYSHKDKEWLDRIQICLKMLKLEGIEIDVWDDTQIKAGDKWRDEITKALEEAKIAILLISMDYLASDFIVENELPPLLEAAEKDGARIIPLLIRPSRFTRNKELSQFQAFNDPNKPLSMLSEAEQDEVRVRLANEIERLLNS